MKCVDIYAISDKLAETLLTIVESAKAPTSVGFSGELMSLLSDDFNIYLHGGRTAEETAVIMENRVQTYLNEQ
ncbi:MAG: hypothetical protein LBD23_18020 [Oscillospiraceae bacterium]|jgi:hypothetical protein|nr:hypothetical protein [Oscillospiraceae bacterium]